MEGWAASLSVCQEGSLHHSSPQTTKKRHQIHTQILTRCLFGFKCQISFFSLFFRSGTSLFHSSIHCYYRVHLSFITKRGGDRQETDLIFGIFIAIFMFSSDLREEDTKPKMLFDDYLHNNTLKTKICYKPIDKTAHIKNFKLFNKLCMFLNL